MSDSANLWRRVSSAVLSAPLVLGLLGGAQAASAQSGHRTMVGLMPTAGTTTLGTRSAPVGSKVWIRTANLPPHTEVQIMLGALRDGFEVLTTRMTDERGKFEGMDSLQVEVPAWVKQDRPYLMIVTDTNYNPLGAADMFHPTDANGTLARTGRVSQPAGGCPVLTGDAEEVYYLMGISSGLKAGDRITVVGHPVESVVCGNGTTIEVRKLERVSSP